MKKRFDIWRLTFGIGLLLATAHGSMLTAFAQGTPGTIRCPTQADTLDSLFRLTDSARTNLSTAATSGGTSITVLSTSSFPSSGSIKIDVEVIYYTSKTSTTFEGLVRGASGTTAASHGINALVQSPILSAHHNALAAAIICAQEKALAAQVADVDLAAIAGLSPANDDVIQRKSGSWINRTIAQLKVDLAVNNIDNTSDANKPVSTAQQAAIDAKVTANAGITGATKTKITYDAKGLVTAGADATTADVADSTDKRYVTDAQRTVIQNTSGTNTGDQDLSGKVTANSAITGATKTKITYDSKGLVTAGADATTADVADSTDKRYITDAQRTVIQNTSGVNAGDQTDATLTFTDITTNNSSTTKHGFLKKLDNDASHFLNGQGNWVAGGGITNSAGANVVPKSDGTNLVSSASGTALLGAPTFGVSFNATDPSVKIGDWNATDANGSMIEIFGHTVFLGDIDTNGFAAATFAPDSKNVVIQASANFLRLRGDTNEIKIQTAGTASIGDVDFAGHGTKITTGAAGITLSTDGVFVETDSNIRSTAAGQNSLGGATRPWLDVFIGNAANNSSQITGNFTGNRTATLPDESGIFQLSRVVAFASLPACNSTNEGMLRGVSNSNTNTWGATIAGGGANHVLAYCNGTNWTVSGK